MSSATAAVTSNLLCRKMSLLYICQTSFLALPCANGMWLVILTDKSMSLLFSKWHFIDGYIDYNHRNHTKRELMIFYQ